MKIKKIIALLFLLLFGFNSNTVYAANVNGILEVETYSSFFQFKRSGSLSTKKLDITGIAFPEINIINNNVYPIDVTILIKSLPVIQETSEFSPIYGEMVDTDNNVVTVPANGVYRFGFLDGGRSEFIGFDVGRDFDNTNDLCNLEFKTFVLEGLFGANLVNVTSTGVEFPADVRRCASQLFSIDVSWNDSLTRKEAKALTGSRRAEVLPVEVYAKTNYFLVSKTSEGEGESSLSANDLRIVYAGTGFDEGPNAVSQGQSSIIRID